MSKNSPINVASRWFKGEKKTLHFDITDVNDAALDVSGFALKWVLEDPYSPTDVLEKTSGGSGITVIDGAGTKDRVVVVIDAADTSGLTAQSYKHALWRTDSGNEALLSEGIAELQDSAIDD